MIYLAENLRQTTLATIFGVSQPTISRAITRTLSALDAVLPAPPDPYALDPHRYYVLGWNINQVMELKKTITNSSAANMQLLVIIFKYSPITQGDIYYISPPQPGSYHDMKALKPNRPSSLLYLLITSPQTKVMLDLVAMSLSKNHQVNNYKTGTSDSTNKYKKSAT